MEDEAEKVKQASASATATFNKTREEEKRLKAIADQGQDPRVLRQQEALKKGAKIVDQKPFEGHKVVEASGAVTVGTATIEEQPKPLQVDDAVTRRDS